MRRYQSDEITEPHLLLVEGINDAILFERLARYYELDRVQIINAEGKDNFGKELKLVKLRSNRFRVPVVKSIGIARDADEDASAAHQSVCRALHSVGLSVNREKLEPVEGAPRVIILILPGNGKLGALETVCLDSVKGEPMMSCVNEFSECVEKEWVKQLKARESVPSFAKLHKMKAHAFLASNYDDPELRLGEAAQKGVWPLGHHAFEGIKAFLTQLCKAP